MADGSRGKLKAVGGGEVVDSEGPYSRSTLRFRVSRDPVCVEAQLEGPYREVRWGVESSKLEGADFDKTGRPRINGYAEAYVEQYMDA